MQAYEVVCLCLVRNLTISAWVTYGYVHKLTQVDLHIFFGRHLTGHRRLINILRLHLSPRYGHVTLVSGFPVLTAVN